MQVRLEVSPASVFIEKPAVYDVLDGSWMKIRVGGDENFLSMESIEHIEFYLEPV